MAAARRLSGRSQVGRPFDLRILEQIYDEGWGPSVLDPFVKDFSKFVSEGDAVLDVGCGPGLVTLEKKWAGYLENGRLVVPYYTDLVVASKE